MKKILIGAAALTIMVFAVVLIVGASTSDEKNKKENTEMVKAHAGCNADVACGHHKEEAKATCCGSCDNCTCGGKCDPAKCASSCTHDHSKTHCGTTKACGKK